MALELYNQRRADPVIKAYLLNVLLKSIEKLDDQFFTLKDVFVKLDIPSDKRETIIDIIKHEGYGKFTVSINPKVKVLEAGLKYIDELQEELFQNNQPIPGMTEIDLPINETKELIFSLHKEGNGRLSWNKETFDKESIPRNRDAAKRQMIHDGVIIDSSTPRIKQSVLSSLAMNAYTYAEALTLIVERNKPLPTTVTTVNMRDGIAMANSPQSQIKQQETQPINQPTRKQIIIGVFILVIGTVALYWIGRLLGWNLLG